ncbi:hypothetical protein ACSYR0_00470 (plasmid) [Bacillus cereus]|uniref:hypothetical protein n=1 Tax=Bacillus cereus TaxID=1396 RepID=UPI0002E5DB6B
MKSEIGMLDLNELSHVSVMGIEFGYKYDLNNESNDKQLTIIPVPSEIANFNESWKKFSYNTLALLRSKYYYGIKHRTDMFQTLYNTFEDVFHTKQKGVNEFLTLQALYSDMIVRLGTIVEDFAGMCFSCEKFLDKEIDIAKSFLSYSGPRNFYESFHKRIDRAKIKKIFFLPRSKGNLDKLFNHLSVEEKNILWEAVEGTTEYISEILKRIASTIIPEPKDNVTLYDMYNKLKHGFSPIYPYRLPMPIVVDDDIDNKGIEGIIREQYFENLTIMHNKLGEQTDKKDNQEFQEKVKVSEYAILEDVTFTTEKVSIEQANTMRELVWDISLIYLHLMKIYLLVASGSSPLEFLLPKSHFSENDSELIASLLINKKI